MVKYIERGVHDETKLQQRIQSQSVRVGYKGRNQARGGSGKMGINKIMLYRWIDEYETHGEEAFVGKGHQRSEEAELRKLRKENEELKMEMEILKKAAAYFAKHPADE